MATPCTIEWDVYLADGSWKGTVVEDIAHDRANQEPDEYARCAAINRFNLDCDDDFSVSARGYDDDELVQIQRSLIRRVKEKRRGS